MEKLCKECLVRFPLDNFHKQQSSRDGHRGICKPCANARTRAWSGNNQERKTANDKAYYRANRSQRVYAATLYKHAHRDQSNALQRQRYQNTLDTSRQKNKERMQAWRAENHEHETAVRHARESLHPEQKNQQLRAWRADHPEETRAATQRHHVRHRETINASARHYYWDHAEPLKAKQRERYAQDPEKHRMQARQWQLDNPEYVLERCRLRRVRRAAVEATLTRLEWHLIRDAYNLCCAYCDKPMSHLTQDHIIPISKGGPHTATNIVPACRSCNSKKGVGPPLIPLEELVIRHPFHQQPEPEQGEPPPCAA